MLDVWTDGEDVDVDAAEAPWMETRARTRACGVAGDDAEDAVAGEGEATLTRTRLGADARPGRCGRRRSHSGCRCRRGARFVVAVFCSCGACLALVFLGVTPTDARNAARC